MHKKVQQRWQFVLTCHDYLVRFSQVFWLREQCVRLISRVFRNRNYWARRYHYFFLATAYSPPPEKNNYTAISFAPGVDKTTNQWCRGLNEEKMDSCRPGRPAPSPRVKIVIWNCVQHLFFHLISNLFSVTLNNYLKLCFASYLWL